MAMMELTVHYKANKDADLLQHVFTVDPANKVEDLAAEAATLWELETADVTYCLHKGKTFLPAKQTLAALVEMGKLQSGDTVRMSSRLTNREQRRALTNAAQRHAATRQAVDDSKEEIIDHVVHGNNKVGVLERALLHGECPPPVLGQTDAQRLKVLRQTVRHCHGEIPALAEREAIRKATAKREALEGVTAAAVVADGSVACVNLGDVQIGDLTVEQLDEKDEEAKALRKTIASRKRKIQAEERAALRAVPKAKAEPKAKAKAKAPRGGGGRGRGGRSQPSSSPVPGPSSAVSPGDGPVSAEAADDVSTKSEEVLTPSNSAAPKVSGDPSAKSSGVEDATFSGEEEPVKSPTLLTPAVSPGADFKVGDFVQFPLHEHCTQVGTIEEIKHEGMDVRVKYAKSPSYFESVVVGSDCVVHHRPEQGEVYQLTTCCRAWQVQLAEPLTVVPVEDDGRQCDPQRYKCSYCKKVANGIKLFKLQ